MEVVLGYRWVGSLLDTESLIVREAEEEGEGEGERVREAVFLLVEAVREDIFLGNLHRIGKFCLSVGAVEESVLEGVLLVADKIAAPRRSFEDIVVGRNPRIALWGLEGFGDVVLRHEMPVVPSIASRPLRNTSHKCRRMVGTRPDSQNDEDSPV
jgi:hypothetical protein